MAEIRKHFLGTDKFKTNIICILIRRNLNKEEVTKNSLITNILKNGSLKYPSIKLINRKIEDIFGCVFDIQIIKKSEEQIFQFYLEYINSDKNAFEESLRFLKEIIFNPLERNGKFEQVFFDIEKENLKKYINSKKNDKMLYAKQKAIEIMCENEPFSINGEGDVMMLEKIKNEELFSHYKNILSDSLIEILILGAFDKKKSFSRIDDIFKGFNKTINYKLNDPIFPKMKNNEISEELLEDVAQSKIILGFRCREALKGKRLYSLLIFNEILGGGSESKLFSKIREEKNLCYFIYSYLYRFKSIIFIESGVESDKLNLTKKLILKELNSIVNGDFSKNDFNNAKLSLINNFYNIEDNQSSILDFYVSQLIAKDNDDVENIINTIDSIIEKDITNIGKELNHEITFYLKSKGEN